jgi:hypothetical protein
VVTFSLLRISVTCRGVSPGSAPFRDVRSPHDLLAPSVPTRDTSPATPQRPGPIAEWALLFNTQQVAETSALMDPSPVGAGDGLCHHPGRVG